ncbi:MAG TPA: phage holin family protein [Candidatus Limnocylindrales bacterium]|nr:phage holin family protein [Candidatus Limnocylindrales bacterium]
MHRVNHVHTEKSLGTVLSETKEELKDFVQTRIAMLRAELKEKINTWKYAIPLMFAAAVLLLAGVIVLTFAFVALVAAWLPQSPFNWFWAGLIVAGIYFVMAVAIGWFAYAEFNSVGVAPNRTLEVLKQDQVWMQNEARTA